MSPGEDLDSLVSRVDPDRWLASRFVGDPALRAALVGLYAFDHELARAPRTSTNPLIGEVRLTWWSEAADEVFAGKPARQHPVVLALAELKARGLLRADLEPLIDARYRELDPAPMTGEEALQWARDTGGRCAQLAAGLLDPAGDATAAVAAGAGWALSWRAREQAGLAPVAEAERRLGQAEVRRLGAAAFPAVAHAVLGAERRSEGDLRRRFRVILAVARGRV